MSGGPIGPGLNYWASIKISTTNPTADPKAILDAILALSTAQVKVEIVQGGRINSASNPELGTGFPKF